MQIWGGVAVGVDMLSIRNSKYKGSEVVITFRKWKGGHCSWIGVSKERRRR